MEGYGLLDYVRFKEINQLFATGELEKARHLLMEMQSRCIGLHDEIARLKTRVAELEDVLYLSKNLTRENGFYWLTLDGLRQGPFCAHCYETDGALIRLEYGRGLTRCPCCHKDYARQTTARIVPFAK